MTWEGKGLCGKEDPETFFPVTVDVERRAKNMCRRCPVRVECLADAISSRTHFGIWGGMNERERRRTARANPATKSYRQWVQLLSERSELLTAAPRRAAAS